MFSFFLLWCAIHLSRVNFLDRHVFSCCFCKVFCPERSIDDFHVVELFYPSLSKVSDKLGSKNPIASIHFGSYDFPTVTSSPYKIILVVSSNFSNAVSAEGLFKCLSLTPQDPQGDYLVGA